MIKKSGFTLLELLLAIGLSSLIMFGMMKINQGVYRYLEYSHDAMTTNRQVCLLFNQLERDFSCAYIPNISQEEKAGKVDETKKTPGEPEVNPEEENKKKQETLKTFFVGSFDDRADTSKADGKKLEQLKQVSFITTNALHVYGEKRARLVRVIYELVKDKAKSTSDQISYQLVRKETPDISNVKGKIEEFGAPVGPDKFVRQYVVAEDVKAFFVEYSIKKKDLRRDKKPEEKEEKQDPDANKDIMSFEWGHRKELQGVIPQKINLWIDFWNDKKSRSVRFNTMVWVMAYPTPQEPDEKKKAPDGAPAPGTPPVPDGQAPGIPVPAPVNP